MHRRTFLAGTAAGFACVGGTSGARSQSTTAAPAPGTAARFQRPRVDHPLPDGQVARGERNIAAAWFSDATQRYRHFKLGSDHEASSLVVATPDRKNFKLTLPADSVFEDRMPRLADIDGDGQDEIIVVKAYLKTGAALAIVNLKPGQEQPLAIVAETPPIGEPFRWLNPAGIADFDGDGKIDIALVKMPHVLGELQLWTMERGRLVELVSLDNVSNHVAGSRHLALSAVADFNGDGVADLAIPSFDRRSLRFISFKNRKAVEFHRVELQGRAGEDFRLVQKGGRPAVDVGLVGGRRVVIQS